MKTMKVSELVFDYTIYPRQSVDATHVRRLADSLEAGAKHPPVLTDKKTKRIVDGFHRSKSAQLIDGKDAKVKVIEKTYGSEQEILLDAVQLNSEHGLGLSSWDCEHVLDLADRLKIEREQICAAMRVAVKRIESRQVNRRSANGQILKRTNAHMAGKKLTKRQEEANQKLSGMGQPFIINQASELLEANLINREDPAVMEALERLSKALEKFFVPVR